MNPMSLEQRIDRLEQMFVAQSTDNPVFHQLLSDVEELVIMPELRDEEDN